MGRMPTIKLSAKKLEKLRATGTQTDYFDQGANVPGFGVRVSAAGRRVWFLLYRVNGKLKRHTIGTNPPMGLEQARKAVSSGSRWKTPTHRRIPLTS
jgi:hypothetical protein